MKNKIIVLVSVMLLCLCTHRIYADSDYDYEIQHWNNFLGFMVPPVLTEDEYKNASENHEIIAEAYIKVGKARTEVKGFFKHYFPFLLDGDYYYLNLSFPDVLFDKLEKEFEELGYTSEQHDADVKKYRIIVEEPTTLSKEEIFGSKENPLKVNFSVPIIYEAENLEYAASQNTRGDYIQLEIVHPEKEKNEEMLSGRGGRITAEEYPGISRYSLSVVGLPIMVHDPKKVFGYEWFWLGGREQTVYNGMKENPKDYLSSLKRGRLKISMGQGCIDYGFMDYDGFLVLEEKTTGLFYQIDMEQLKEATEIYLDLPASEYFVTMDMKNSGDYERDVPFYYTIGETSSTDYPFIGLIGNEYSSGIEKYRISNPKVTIKSDEPTEISINMEELDEADERPHYNVYREAATQNSEYLVYDYIHADKLLPEQASYALYKLAKAYDKDVPEGYYKQYMTSFEYMNGDMILPLDVKTDAYESITQSGLIFLYEEGEDATGGFFVRGSVYTNGDITKQMFYINGHASPAVSFDTSIVSHKDLFFAYPLDTKTRVCGEMISAYENPEMFGYKKGDIDEREYAIQVLRCCSDLYQFDNGSGYGVQMRFRSHMEKDPSSISGEKMVYDRTVCQYLPESVIKYITFAANTGVLVERDHSTPANSSSLWWEPLKKEPLGEIHLTEKDGETIAPPEPKDPVVETKDGTEPSGSAAVEQETSPSTESRDGSTAESRELKTMEYVEKEPSSFNPATLVIIIIISVFALAAIIGAVVVIKAKKKGN